MYAKLSINLDRNSQYAGAGFWNAETDLGLRYIEYRIDTTSGLCEYYTYRLVVSQEEFMLNCIKHGVKAELFEKYVH